MGLKIVKVGDLRGKPDQMGDRIYSVKGISPTLAAQRGNNSKGSILVSTQTSSTSTPPKFTKNTMEKSTQETLELSMLKKSQTTIYSVLDSLVRALVSLEKGKDLRTPEGLSFLKSLGLQSTKDPDIYSLKTSRVCLVTTKEKLSRQSLGFSPTWGIELNGRYLIASTLEFPKTGKECSLSDILEDSVDEKYFLSEKMTRFLIRNNNNQFSGRYKPVNKKIAATLTKRMHKMGKTDNYIILEGLKGKGKSGSKMEKINQETLVKDKGFTATKE